MASQLWSWIFIIQLLLVRPGHAAINHGYEVLTRRAVGRVFIRDLSDAEAARNITLALAVSATVLLFAGLLGLFLVVRGTRKQKVPEPELGLVSGKPAWWMVEGKNEKMDWWRLSHRIEPVPAEVVTTSPKPDGRIARLKAAIQCQAVKDQIPILPMHHTPSAPLDILGVPVQTNSKVQAVYPESLERGYRAPIYQAQPTPQIPALYIGDKPLKRSLITPPRVSIQRLPLARSGARYGLGVPRSPAGRRRDRLHRLSFRHPFLPLKTPDVLKISAPVRMTEIDPTNPKLNYPGSLTQPRMAPTPPGRPRASYRPPVPPKGSVSRRLAPPAPLNLDLQDSQPRSARPHYGLPASPRPRMLNSAF